MTKTISYIPKVISNFFDMFSHERLGYFFVSSILISAAIYISGLNMAIAENFHHGKIEVAITHSQHDLAAKNEFFVQKLSEFYAENAASFNVAQSSKQQFVNRGGASVARAGGAAIR